MNWSTKRSLERARKNDRAPKAENNLNGRGSKREKANQKVSHGKRKQPPSHQDQSVDYVAEITKYWRRGVKSCLEVGRLCAKASKAWSDAKREDFIAQLPFKKSAFSKYTRIGLDKRLYSEETRRLLPPRYTTLYTLTRLTDDDFKLAVSEGVIHPGLEREELEAWREAREPRPNKEPAASDIHIAMPGSKEAKTTASNLRKSAEVQPTALNSNQTTEAGPLATLSVGETESPAIVPSDDGTIPQFLDRRQPSSDDETNLKVLLRTWDVSSDWVRQQFKQHIQAGTAHE